MFESIKGKRVLVTGASVGIGSAIVKLFAEYGAIIGIHYRDSKEEAQKLQKEIQSNSGSAEIFQGDLLDKDARQNLIKSFIQCYEGIDVLINNAGAVYDYKHYSELSESAWDNTFALNVKAPFFLIRSAFDFMKGQNAGRIINISSASVKYGGSAKGFHYSASKGALDTLTVGFSREGAPHNILVNSIRCGVIDTLMHTRIEGYTKEQFQNRVGLIPVKRIGQPIDIARMTLFLASESGDFITGQIIPVSGGD